MTWRDPANWRPTTTGIPGHFVDNASTLPASVVNGIVDDLLHLFALVQAGSPGGNTGGVSEAQLDAVRDIAKLAQAAAAANARLLKDVNLDHQVAALTSADKIRVGVVTPAQWQAGSIAYASVFANLVATFAATGNYYVLFAYHTADIDFADWEAYDANGAFPSSQFHIDGTGKFTGLPSGYKVVAWNARGAQYTTPEQLYGISGDTLSVRKVTDTPEWAGEVIRKAIYEKVKDIVRAGSNVSIALDDTAQTATVSGQAAAAFNPQRAADGTITNNYANAALYSSLNEWVFLKVTGATTGTNRDRYETVVIAKADISTDSNDGTKITFGGTAGAYVELWRSGDPAYVRIRYVGLATTPTPTYWLGNI